MCVFVFNPSYSPQNPEMGLANWTTIPLSLANWTTILRWTIKPDHQLS